MVHGMAHYIALLYMAAETAAHTYGVCTPYAGTETETKQTPCTARCGCAGHASTYQPHPFLLDRSIIRSPRRDGDISHSSGTP